MGKKKKPLNAEPLPLWCKVIFVICLVGFGLYVNANWDQFIRVRKVIVAGWNMLMDGDEINEYTLGRLRDNAKWRPDDATRKYQEKWGDLGEPDSLDGALNFEDVPEDGDL